MLEPPLQEVASLLYKRPVILFQLDAVNSFTGGARLLRRRQCIYADIYIKRERDRERELNMYTYIYI